MSRQRISHEKSETHSDVIAAIITPPGEGGLGALRVAGAGSLELCGPLLGWQTVHPESFHMRLTTCVHPQSGDALDEVMAVWMPAGKSYTGDEQVEIFTHGGRITLKNILHALFDAGARPAEPGEFTRRAFLAGRIDLSEAEAVAEIISAKSDFAYRAARDNLFGKTSALVDSLRTRVTKLAAFLEANVDFPEEDIETEDYREVTELCRESQDTLKRLIDSYSGGKIIRDGFKVALCGAPNSGKSSLFNALLKTHRALVSETPGTTRDYLSEWIQIGDIAVELSDTAGLRDDAGEIEAAGQEFARRIAEQSDLALWLIDVSESNWSQNLSKSFAANLDHCILIANKTDLLDKTKLPGLDQLAQKHFPRKKLIPISCKTGAGLDALESALETEINLRLPDQTDAYIVTSERHKQKFSEARAALDKVASGLSDNASPELIAFDVRQALNALDEITGKVYTEDLLDIVFANFCVGK